MPNLNRLLIIAMLSVGIKFSSADSLPTANITVDTTCDCTNTELVSEGGFADMYGRYLGDWYVVGSYGDLPLYMCLQGCQGLSDKLVSVNFLSILTLYYSNFILCKSNFTKILIIS